MATFSTAGGIGMDASPIWCFMCSRLHRPDGLSTCPRRSPRAALEEIVEVMDAGEFLQACALRRAPVAAAVSSTRQQLPTVTVRDAGRTCAVCLDDLEPGGSAVVTPCDHAYHPQCIAPWLEAHDTCPLCRRESGLQVVEVEVQVDGMVLSSPDGLVLCELMMPGGRSEYRLGRRVAGRIFAVRVVDGTGKLVRGGVLRRLGSACHRFAAAAGNLLSLRYRDCVIPNNDLLLGVQC